MTKKQKRGLLLILAPFILLIGTAFLQIFSRFIFSGSDSTQGAQVIINIFALVAGLIGVLGFVPCLVIGIVLLVSGGRSTTTDVASSAPLPPEHNQNSPQPPTV